MGERVFRPALSGKASQVVGNPDLPHTYTYVPDIGKGLVILGARDEALGPARGYSHNGSVVPQVS